MLHQLTPFLIWIESRRFAGVIIFLFALLTILTAKTVLPARFFQTHDPPDYANFYQPVAENILQGKGIVTEDGEVAVRYPPGYPMLLAMIYGIGDILDIDRENLTMWFIWLCSALTPVMIFYLARTLFNLATAFLAAFLWISYPFALWLIGQPFSEPPFMVVLIGALWLFFDTLLHHPRRYINFLIFGVLIGVAMLIRPAAIGIGVVTALIVWIVGNPSTIRGRLTASGMILVGNLIAVMPWQLYATSHTDESVMLSSGGLPTTVFGVMFAVHPDRPYHPSIVSIPGNVLALQTRIYLRDEAGEIDTLGAFVRVMADELRSEPGTVIQLMAIKSIRAWYATSSTQRDNIIFLIQLPYLVIAVVASIAVLRQQRKIAVGLLLIVFYLWALTAASMPMLRYMMPAMALLIIMIAALVSAWGKTLLRHTTSPSA